MANKGNNFLKFWLPVYVYAAIIFFFSSMSLPPMAPKGLYGDKLLHLGEYAILGYLIARAARNSGNLKLSMHFRLFAICAALLYGLGDEFHQYFVPGREVDIFDVLADGIGATLGQMIFRG